MRVLDGKTAQDSGFHRVLQTFNIDLAAYLEAKKSAACAKSITQAALAAPLLPMA
jgi:hypothetical protein